MGLWPRPKEKIIFLVFIGKTSPSQLSEGATKTNIVNNRSIHHIDEFGDGGGHGERKKVGIYDDKGLSQINNKGPKYDITPYSDSSSLSRHTQDGALKQQVGKMFLLRLTMEMGDALGTD